MKGLRALLVSLICNNIILGLLTPSRVVRGGEQRGAFQLSATSVPPMEEMILKNLKGMKVVDLKALFQKRISLNLNT